MTDYSWLDDQIAGLDPYHFLEQLVQIDSQVGNHEGIQDAQKMIARELSLLEFDIEYIQNTIAKSAPLIIARKKAHPQAVTISFIGHSDVVTSSSRHPFRIIDNKIYGAGVADNKGGVSACLSGIDKFINQLEGLNLNINVVISPSEETGSIGFQKVFQKLGLESDFVLGLEPALCCGSLITSRSGNRWYYVHSIGKSAHSGRFGNSYINAAHQLSLIISKSMELNDESQMRRVNVGDLSGGHGGYNTICGRAEAKIDMRFSSFDCLNEMHSRFEEIISTTVLSCPYTSKKGQIFYSIEDDCPPLESKNIDSNFLEHALSSINNIEGRVVSGKHAGGAADVNYFSRPGLHCIDGLGPIGGGFHTHEEYIEKDSLITRSNVIRNLLHFLNKTHTKYHRRDSWKPKSYQV